MPAGLPQQLIGTRGGPGQLIKSDMTPRDPGQLSTRCLPPCCHPAARLRSPGSYTGQVTRAQHLLSWEVSISFGPALHNANRSVAIATHIPTPVRSVRPSSSRRPPPATRRPPPAARRRRPPPAALHGDKQRQTETLAAHNGRFVSPGARRATKIVRRA